MAKTTRKTVSPNYSDYQVHPHYQLYTFSDQCEGWERGDPSWNVQIGTEAFDWQFRKRLTDGVRLRHDEVPSPLTGRVVRGKDAPPEPMDVMNWKEFVVSTKCKEFFEVHAPGDAEYFPIELRRGTKSVIHGYWLMNLVQLVDCIDMSSGEYDPEDSTYPFMPKGLDFTYVMSRIPKHVMVFRAVHDSLTALIRPSLAMAINDSSLTGYGIFSRRFVVP